MLSLRKINPMARAVGTMGIVATMVGAVTFANLTSNTVALSPNTLDVASASLEIGDSGCNNLSHTAFPGFNSTNFSTSQPASVTFCLHNDGSVPLVIGAGVAEDSAGTLNNSVAAQNTTLSVTCNSENLTGTLATNWTGNFPTAIPAGGQELCTANATLSSSYNGSGNVAIPGFSVNFTGTEPS